MPHSAFAQCQLIGLELQRHQFAAVDQLLSTMLLSGSNERAGNAPIATVMPNDIRQQLEARYGPSGGIQYFRFDPNYVTQREIAVELERQFEVPYLYHGWTVLSLVRAYRAVGSTSLATMAIEEFLQELPDDEQNFRAKFLVEYCWLMRVSGRAEAGLKKLDEHVQNTPGDPPFEMLPLLIERARLLAKLERWDEAEQELWRFLETADVERLGYRCVSDAWLMIGFLKSRRDDPEGARTAWERARYTGEIGTAASHQHMSGTIGMLNHLLASSLVDQLSDQEIDTIIEGFIRLRLPGVSAFQLSLVRTTLASTGFEPAMLRTAWQHPRGRELAFRFAFQNLSFPELAQVPILVCFAEIIRKTSFENELSLEQEEFLWSTLQLAYADAPIIIEQHNSDLLPLLLTALSL